MRRCHYKIRTKVGSSNISETGRNSLKLKDIIGSQCIERQGLGSIHFQQWGKADPRQRGDMIQAEVCHMEEDRRQPRAVELASQGAWTKWDLPKWKITWPEL
ncbi:Cytosolic 10-formyltetrahydrofolate dehydrogenase [Dissostichus eleginoides]|uniref:Cytosolic 10-formyltetrahydrofolate dehydrogenase n=1 Tax=Dissostichus eleginoides TaxID=100907 RepID=A0AAD9C2J0_DISEL|nr:Cytosolic 10-formyltetrahydrofolate dehydrogenase [Dissostichus eleginoides]